MTPDLSGLRRAEAESPATDARRTAVADGPSRLPGYPQRSLLSFLFFLAFVVARYIQLAARRDILATIRVEFLLGIIVIIVVWREFMARKPMIGGSTRFLWAVGFLFITMLIQLPFAADPVLARTIFWDRVVKFALLTSFMAVLLESPRYLAWFIGTFLFSIYYITLEATQGLITGGLVWENQGIMRLHGAVPIYAHPNSLGGVALGAIPFVVFLWSHAKRWYFRLFLLALAGTSMTCVVYSGSRTAYLGLLGFVLYWWVVSRRKIRFILVGAIIGTIGIAMLPAQYIQRFESIGGKEAEGSSKEARIEILRDAVQIFREHPLGVGIASFPAVRIARFGRSQDTHNLYLEVATNLGVQGLITFLIMVGMMMNLFISAAKSFRTQHDRLGRAAARKLLPPERTAVARSHYQSLRFLESMSHAGGAFIFIRLILGFFGMDLYEVYWWFGAGLAIALSGLVTYSRRRTKAILGVSG